MHEMDNTKKIITIIGLCFEFLGVLGIAFAMWFFNNYDRIPGLMDDLTADEVQFIEEFFGLFASFMFIILIVVSVVVLVNIYLFSKLIGGKYTESQAKKVYLYQAIWGGINLLSNQVTGILYLISGVGGYNGHREETDIREGI